MQKKLMAIRHIAFEDLDSLETVFARRGFAIEYRDAQVGVLKGAAEADLLVVLGGPFAAYDTAHHRFLAEECDVIERRLAAGRPTLGICLGAQLIARTLGARNYPGASAEIGWAPVRLVDCGKPNPLSPLEELAVLHWHGDTFDLPAGALALAATDAYPNQAFSAGPTVLGLQFHLEVTAAGFERWLTGHGLELVGKGIDPRALRAAAQRSAPALAAAAGRLIENWIDGWSKLGETSPM